MSCAPARATRAVGNPLCSKFCCMYSLKQNQLIMGVLGFADVTVHYLDIRAVGKGYEEFFEQAKGMGVNFTKGRVAGIRESGADNLILRYEDIDRGGVLAEAEYDLVVLAVGVQAERRRRETLRQREARRSTSGPTSTRSTRTSARRRRAFPASSWRAPSPVPGTSRSRSCTPGRRPRRSRRISSARRRRRRRHERAAARRLRLPVRRQHRRLRRRRPGHRRRQGPCRRARRAARDVHLLGRQPAGDDRRCRQGDRSTGSSSRAARPSCTRSPSAAWPNGPA